MSLKLDQTRFIHLLQTHEDTQLGVLPGEAALEVDGVRLPNGAISAQLDAAAWTKAPAAMMTLLS